MLKYYQKLLNECINLAIWKEQHQGMLSTLATMKDNLSYMKGGN